MISIIICSRTAELNATLAANIEDSIGVEYELILIDNSDNRYGICQAYNKGVALSKYEILCFMHDDISYHTQNWGQNILAHFEHHQVSAIGVAGSPYCAFMPGPWWGSGLLYENLIQGNHAVDEVILKANSNGSKARQVTLLDGVWFCVKKSLFNTISFDEKTFAGFHFYDMDICMQINEAGGNIYCINDVLIAHASLGNVNHAWIDSALTFHQKWENLLPFTTLRLNTNQSGKLEYKTLNSFILACAANGYANKVIYKLALKYLVSFRKGYFFYKTPGYFIKFLFKYLFKKGAPFYNLSY